MEYKLYRKADQRTSIWSGGTTTQLAIFPADSVYMERNFVWRLSTATCEEEESTFSRLPDFDRILMVLKGNVILAHQDVRVAKLGEMEQDSFDGAYRTKSFGVITDYNLMIRKGNKGALEPVNLESNNMTLECPMDENYSLYTTALYCKEGFCTLSINGDTVMISQGDQIVIDSKMDESLQLSVMGEGTLVRTHIWFNYESDTMRPTYIPPEKTSFDDFLTCMYLANIQFRGAGFFFKKLKTQWFDEELSKAINKIENIYLTFFVGLAGAIAAGALTINSCSAAVCALAIIAWLIVDILIVSPLIYLAVVPKPTRKHIKDISQLTPYEQAVREKELGTNVRLEKLMKKYEKSGRMAEQIRDAEKNSGL